MNKFLIYAKSIAIPVLVGIVVGWLTMSSMDYASLNQPPFAPPGFIFPIVWSILYVLMGVSYGILKTKELTDTNVDKTYYLQLGINALWSIFFFVLKWRLFSFFWIIMLGVAVYKMIEIFMEKDKLAGRLQIPYLIWIVFAGYLNFGVYLLNRV